MAGDSPYRQEKTADYKISGQIQRLESERAELLKGFDKHPADVETQLSKNKALSAEREYQRFSGTYDDLEENSQLQRQLIKPEYLEYFDGDTERNLREMKKTLN